MKNESNIIDYKNLLYLLDRAYLKSLENPKKIFTQKEDRLWYRLCQWSYQDEEEFEE